MRGAFELLGEATSDGRIIRNLFDEVDIGKAIFSELANYAEMVLVDANIASTIKGLRQGALCDNAVQESVWLVELQDDGVGVSVLDGVHDLEDV